ncbi:MAG: tRNA (cytidine(34)-2'-O)-methyltransferase [Prosthecobacter sp.]|jgi:tRNA (cytidine/uridine-2'-O-)-methyltransferase|nr:tRNA (cytidine(34)-2'-O)-methyltransferase [Prosthecobacter sp.]
MIHIVLYQPEIPHNTGAVGRLCLATGARLHLIKPLGFSLEDRYLKRSGLDYWHEVDVRVWEGWEDFYQGVGKTACLKMVEVQGSRLYWECDLTRAAEIFLVYGPETRGIPPSILGLGESLHIPMLGTRSLNLSTAVSVVLYETVRQRTLAGRPLGS